MEGARLTHPVTRDKHGEKTERGSPCCTPSTLSSFYGAEIWLITQKIKGFKRALTTATLKELAPPSAPQGLWPRPRTWSRPALSPSRALAAPRTLATPPALAAPPGPPGSQRGGRKMLEWGGLAVEVTSERGRLMRAAPWGEDAGGGDGRELRELQAAPGAV